MKISQFNSIKNAFAAIGVLSTIAIVIGASRPAHANPIDARANTPASTDADSLWIEMRNVDLHIDDDHVMHVRALDGRVVPTTAGSIALLDDPKSFSIRPTAGVVALDGPAITALLNEIAFNYPSAPIKGLRVEIENGQLVQHGTLHKGVDIPFQMWSTPKLEADGRLRLHPDKLHIFGVNGITLMHALGLHLSKMMDLSGAKGASVDGDDILLDPMKIIPPPAIDGRLSAVRIEGSQLVQEFGRAPSDSIFGTFVKPDSGSRNFVYFRGGQLRFGRLTMTDTDLLIHDADESDPFDLYFAKYNAQLAAGQTKNLPDFGLRTWMIDYGKLGQRTVVASRAATGTGVQR